MDHHDHHPPQQSSGETRLAVAFFVTAGGTSAEKIARSMEKLCGKKSIAYVGFIHKELKDNNKYKAKLPKFLESFKQK